MLSLRLFLIVFVSFVCKEAMSGRPTVEWPIALTAVVGCVMGFGLLSKSAALFLIKPHSASVLAGQPVIHASVYQFREARAVIEWCWLVALPPLLHCSQWARWSNHWIEMGMPHVLGAAMILGPTLVLMALLELSSAQLDQAVGGGQKTVAQYWQQRLRLGDFVHLCAAVLPVLVITGSNDLLTYLLPNTTDSGWIAAVSVTLGIAVVGVGYPHFYAATCGVRPVDAGPLQQIIEQWARRLGLRGMRAVIVPSGGRWCGAAVVGIVPGQRFLWLGDGLLSRLTDSQLDMVILHELAHLRRRHFWWRVLPVVCAGLVPVALLAAQSAVGTDVAGSAWPGAIGALLVAGLVLVVGLGWSARWCELDADRQACRYAAQWASWADGSRSAACQAMQTALRAVMSDAGSQRATWLHPGLGQRIDNLARFASADRSFPKDAGRETGENLGGERPTAAGEGPITATHALPGSPDGSGDGAGCRMAGPMR